MNGRGINLGGVLDRRDGRAGWRVRGEHLDDVAAAGFTAVRLPVCWWAHADPGRLLDTAAELIDAIRARGLGVVLTMHHADGVHADPERLLALWRRIAGRFAGTPGPLAYDLLNEPRITAAEWNALLPAALRAVREADPERPVIVSGAEAGTVAGLRDLELPPDEHLIASVHYYEPFRFTHQGAPWEPGSDAWLGTTWGTEDDRAAVTADLEAAAAWARERGVPLYVGEFGTYDAADDASRVRWTTWVRNELERLELPWAYWDLATDFGAYDADRREWRQDLLEALLPPTRPAPPSPRPSAP